MSAPNALDSDFARRLLGGLIVGNEDALDAARKLVAPADFDDSRLALVFGAALRLHADGRPVTLLDLRDALSERGELDSAGGVAFLAALADEAVTAAYVEADARRVAAMARERREAASGAAILERVRAYLTSYVVFASAAQSVAVTLWVAHTYVFARFETSPYLAVTSPEKRSGKTRLLDALELIVPRPWRVVLPSEAVVFRKICAHAPTLLLDEVDAIFRRGATEHEGLRALLNAGHRAGSTVPRCVGTKNEIQDFTVFCPKAIAGIGELPDTVADRSIPIRLRRRAHGEKVERFRLRHAKPEAERLHALLADWTSTALSGYVGEPEVPEGLDDRAVDGWEALLAIANAAGGEWPERARAAALALHADPEEREQSLGVRLLSDLRRIFDDGDHDVVFTDDAVQRLNTLDESPWGAFREGKGLDARGLARLLRPYGVRPRDVRDGEAKRKGYRRASLADAWARYLPDPSAAAEAAIFPRHRDNLSDSRTCDVAASETVSGEKSGNAAESLICRGVSDRSAADRDGADSGQIRLGMNGHGHRLPLEPVAGIELYMLDGDPQARVWELRRDGEVLARTEPEDHAMARSWIAALERGDVPADART